MFFVVVAAAAPHAQWVQTAGPANRTVLSLAARDSFVFAGTYNGAYVSRDSGMHWTVAGTVSPTAGRVPSLALAANAVVAGTEAGVFRSLDNGASWIADSGMPGQTLVHSLAATATGVFAGTHTRGVFLLPDAGGTWQAVDSGLPASTSVYSLAAGGDAVIAGTWAAGIFRYGKSGPAWAAADSGLPPSALGAYVLSLAAAGANAVAGIGSAVYFSFDNGTHWSAANAPQIQSDVNGLLAGRGGFFAATYSSGVFYSADLGGSWSDISAGLPQGNQGMCLAAAGPYLFLGSGNNGVWRRPFSEIMAIERPIAPSKSGSDFIMELRGNNAGSMAIAFRLSRPQHAVVSLYSLAGRLMATLASRMFQAGENSIECDTRAIAATCCVVKVKTGSFEKCQRVALMR